MVICIDFDGTLVEHRYPDIGAELPGAFEWLRKFQEAGAKLILWTMRGDAQDGPMLSQAVEFCRQRGIEFFAVNDNPSQHSWTNSRKCHANIYIDDAAYGCPLRQSARLGGRPCVNWDKVGPKVLALIPPAT